MYNEPTPNACAPGMGQSSKELQVPEQISRQAELLKHFQEVIERTENVLTILTERTSPVRTSVLTRSEVRPVDPQVPQQTLVPVADAIRSNNQTIDSLIDRTANIKEAMRSLADSLQI